MGHPRLPFHKIQGFLRQGTSPKHLAMSATLGLLLGVFPLLGLTTVAMSALSLRYPLNLPLMLTLSYLVFPLQILLIIPFVRLGEWALDARPVGLSAEALQAAFSSGLFTALRDLGVANLMGVLGWATVALPLGVVMYRGLVFCFRIRSKNTPLPKRFRPGI